MSTETFVGGPWDGQRIEVRDGVPNIWAPNPQRGTYPAITSSSGMIEVAKQVLYKRMFFAGEKQTYSLFVVESLTSDDVFRMLIYRYSKGVQT